jgi:hypothetical protein
VRRLGYFSRGSHENDVVDVLCNRSRRVVAGPVKTTAPSVAPSSFQRCCDARLDSVVECGLLWFSLTWIDAAARSTVLYAVQGRWPHHGPQGFDAAMSRTHSTRDRRRKNRAVVEARPSRDSIAPRDAAKGYLDRLRRLENQLQRSIGTSCRWSTCDAGRRQACGQPPWLPS